MDWLTESAEKGLLGPLLPPEFLPTAEPQVIKSIERQVAGLEIQMPLGDAGAGLISFTSSKKNVQSKEPCGKSAKDIKRAAEVASAISQALL